VATLNRDCAEPADHPREQPGPPEFRLRDETKFPRDRRPEDDGVEHRLMIRGDDRGSSCGHVIGADHLDSIDGAHQAAEDTANLRIGRGGERNEILTFVHPRVDKSFHQATSVRRHMYYMPPLFMTGRRKIAQPHGNTGGRSETSRVRTCASSLSR
jgi:hypothetical protein